MNPGRWEEIERTFVDALDRSGAEREAYLTQACSGDAELRREVEALLSEHDTNPDFLETPIGGLPEPVRTDGYDLDHRIGPYHIVRPLGRGGMGQVFLAMREEAGVKQPVALKVLRKGLDTEDLLARFHQERRILGTLRHRNIASLLDVGSTADGRPYLAMEYVEGRPLQDYCDTVALPIEDRIGLMIAVCQAVQHAHQSLIVHRDLKPSNILVSDAGEPKLLDFGIAKILDPEVASPALTRTGVRPLTPEYAAPEQIRAEAVTTACDIYALGVLLYQVLAGRYPYGADRASLADLERAILEEDPPEPSRIAGVGASPDEPPGNGRQRGGAAHLRRRLRGDLDTIVLKAMRKEPNLRYPSAASLAEDLQRHLDGMPVRARPPTVRYRASKFIRRNRLPVAAASSAMAVLAASSVLLALQGNRLQGESARVAHERDKAVEVKSFLLEMFGTTGPDRSSDAATARQLLDTRAERLSAEFGGDPEMEAEMAIVLAEGYERIGLFEEAEVHARRSLVLRTDLFGEAHADVASARNTLGWIRHRQGHHDEAEELLRSSLETWRRLDQSGDGLPRVLNDLGVVREAQGDLDEAAALYQESLATREASGLPRASGWAVTASNLSVVHYRQGNVEAALEMAEASLDVLRRVLGGDHQRSLVVQSNLAAMRAAAGDLEGAIAQNRDILERRVRLFGMNHPDVARSQTLLAEQLRSSGDAESAAGLLEAALATLEGIHSGPHEDLARAHANLGSVLAQLERYEEGRRELESSLAMHRALGGNDQEVVGQVLLNLGWASRSSRDFAEAERRFLEAAGVFETVLGNDHPRTGRSLQLAAEVVGRTDPARAAALFARAAAILERSEAPDSPRMQELRRDWALTELALGHLDRADSLASALEQHLAPDQGSGTLAEELRRLERAIEEARR